MTDDPGFRRETHATVEPTLEQQVAYWKARAEHREEIIAHLEGCIENLERQRNEARARVERAERERDMLVKALAFYADEKNHNAMSLMLRRHPEDEYPAVVVDRGHIARAALAAVSPPQEGGNK